MAHKHFSSLHRGYQRLLLVKPLLLLSWCLSSVLPRVQAQVFDPIAAAAKDRKIMAKTEFLFEGEAISASGYVNEKESILYSSYIVRVTKVIKGRLNDSLVRVSAPGPPIQLDSGLPAGQVLIVESSHPTSGGSIPLHTPLLVFARLEPSTFFHNPAPKPSGVRLDLEGVGTAFFDPSNGTNSTVGGHFADKQALYQHLATEYQIPLPAPDQPRKAPLREAAIDSAREQMPDQQKRARKIRQAKEGKRSPQKH